MYLLYEHHKSAEGAVLATDMLMTSFFPGKPGINFKNKLDAMQFEFTKSTFKDVHIALRSYDPETKVWSFFPPAGSTVYKALKDSPIVSAGLKIERIEDLVGQVKAGYVHVIQSARIDPADFFYTPEAPVPSGPSREQIRAKLSVLLSLPEAKLEVTSQAALKSTYRRAALLYHPDRNNGDGSRMSELNALWQSWSIYAPQEVKCP